MKGLLLVCLLGLLVPVAQGAIPPAAPALTATVEWDIVAPSPPGPARTLLLDVDTPGIGPIEDATCATWDSGTQRLTLYDRTVRPPRGTCYPAAKVIRRIGPDSGRYSLSWAEGSTPFYLWLPTPGTVLPVTLLPNGGVAVVLP